MLDLQDQYAPAVCDERRKRIRIAIAAWAYERYAAPIMSDAEFDKLAREIQPSMTTGNAKLDAFFATEFNPSTGQWIYRHPELDKVDALLRRHWRDKTVA